MVNKDRDPTSRSWILGWREAALWLVATPIAGVLASTLFFLAAVIAYFASCSCID